MAESKSNNSLFSSVRKGEYEAVRELVDSGVSIDSKNTAGKSLAHLAAANGHTKVSMTKGALQSWYGVLNLVVSGRMCMSSVNK